MHTAKKPMLHISRTRNKVPSRAAIRKKNHTLATHSKTKDDTHATQSKTKPSKKSMVEHLCSRTNSTLTLIVVSLLDTIPHRQEEQKQDQEVLRVLMSQLAQLQLEMSTMMRANAWKLAKPKPPNATSPNKHPSNIGPKFHLEQARIDRDDELWEEITSSPLLRILWACMPIDDSLGSEDMIPPHFLPRAKKAIALLRQQPFWAMCLPTGWSDFLLEVFDISTHVWSTPWSAQCKHVCPLDYAFSPFHIDGNALDFHAVLSSKDCFVRTDLNHSPLDSTSTCLRIRLGV